MDEQVKKEWISALRSGKYKKERGRLHKGSNYSCFGVLSEIVPSNLPEYFGWWWNGYKWQFVNDETFAVDWVPGPVLCYISFPEEKYYNLSRMNYEGSTFNDIANYIEFYL